MIIGRSFRILRCETETIFSIQWLCLSCEKLMKLSVLIHSAEEGGYWAEVPALPGCVSEGDTLDEITANIKEAVEGWLEVAAERTARAIVQVTETETTLLSIDV
jgi:predicted RNase H-like HicB family nuclease